MPSSRFASQPSLFISYWINLQTSLFCDIYKQACLDERSRENRWRNFGKFLILLRLFLALISYFLFCVNLFKTLPFKHSLQPPTINFTGITCCPLIIIFTDSLRCLFNCHNNYPHLLFSCRHKSPLPDRIILISSYVQRTSPRFEMHLHNVHVGMSALVFLFIFLLA